MANQPTPYPFLNPKQRFIADSESSKKWLDLVASDVFIKAADAALLQYSRQVAEEQKDYQMAAAAHFKMAGAAEFLKVLIQIAIPVQISKQIVDDKLNYKA